MKFDSDDLIINRPDLVPPGQKFTAWGVTLFFWGALLYLWQPLLSLLAWGLNIRLFYNHMILLGGYEALVQLAAEYAEVIAMLGGGLILWARINLWRFRGKDRRRGMGDTNMQKLMEEFGVTEATLSASLDSRIVKISATPQGKIISIEQVPGADFSQNAAVAPQEPSA